MRSDNVETDKKYVMKFPSLSKDSKMTLFATHDTDAHSSSFCSHVREAKALATKVGLWACPLVDAQA
jgi:hypothetical protein